ncbi:enoyl-CoA hydratase-related protein (plasmid) [Embleya sp. NBC_00888]|uniref:enoyl-CoA hydratase-related protein n=1 Tax=Embleya sp. NBC_00888 TaxID=2975960 RepID=UPI002F919ECD|nr:enoyl-CoA hydratase-related protein [Embleya sp. NBC_00888]
MSEILQVIKEPGWRHFVLNRPEKRNALSMPLLEALRDALAEADADDDVSAVLITANGPDFCSGMDVGSDDAAEPNARNTDLDMSKHVEAVEAPRRLLRSLWTFRKPVVVLVHGHCLAAGTELVALCDIAIVTDDAQLGFPPIRDMGTTAAPMWTYYAGPQWSRRLLYTGDSISGADAARIGLVLKALPADQARAEALGLVRRLSKIDWQLLASQKRIENTTLELMGLHMLHKMAAMTDGSAMTSPTARQLANTPREEYIAVLKRRRTELFGPGIVNVTGPDPFDDDGRLLDGTSGSLPPTDRGRNAHVTDGEPQA